MTVNEQITEAEERILEGITSLHEQLVEANAQAAERLAELRLPAPDVEPAVEPAAAVAHYYDFAGKLLDANRKFAEQVVTAWYPATKAAPKRSAAKAK
jgi:hypothetical protein